jgi:3-hydroxyisobutyrate dehydrogenase
MKIAFLGMGLMGAPMALRCLQAGHALTVYNRTAAKCAPLVAAGAAQAASPALAASGQEAILLCIEDTAAAEALLFGPGGIVHGLKPDTQPPPLVIDHSTISAAATERFAARLERETGAWLLDAPVSGGDAGARAGTLAIMCGGRSEAFARARPLLEAMGRTIVHIGPRPGDGQRAKTINQLLVAVHCMATTEAMRLGEGLGLNMERVLEAISQGAAGSWSLSNLGPRWLMRDFQPGFRLRHLLKDMGFCAEAIEFLKDDRADAFPAAALARELIARAVAQGHGDENIHALARPLAEKQ